MATSGKFEKDALGTRMKEFYENVTRTYLPRRTYTIIRVDGKAFHTFTRKFKRPFDDTLIDMMNQTAKYMAENVQGCKLAYVQSDEISLVLTDFDDIKTSAWFDGNVQKMCSVAASLATSRFNLDNMITTMATNYNVAESGNVVALMPNLAKIKIVQFDARVFTIPTMTEVMNYLVWRQKDSTRNSISMVAQSLYSHKELNGKSTDQMQEMIFQKGINWNDYDAGMKRGRCIVRRISESVDASDLDVLMGGIRKKWMIENPPIFTEDRTYLPDIIPENI